MSLKDLWTMIKTAWQSKPIAMLIPPAALVYYYITHGHTFPSMHEWVAGIALWTAQFNQVTSVLFGSSQAPPPASRLSLVAILGLGLALGCTGCPPAGTAVPPQGVTADAGASSACAGVNIDHAIADVATVAVDVASAQYSALLDKLAQETSLQEAKCAVSLFVGMFEKKAALDPMAKTERERAQSWLGSK